MQYVWQHRLWPYGNLATVDGRRVTIIDPGRLNTGPGPDFFNAKVVIDSRTWAGDVEIHERASDWHRHGHDGDPAYDSVILHVVDRDDTVIHRSNGEIIPQMRMPCSPSLRDDFISLADRAPGPMLPCRHLLAALPSLLVTDWISSLAMERLYAKSERISALLTRFNGDWEQTAYVTLARALGFSINAEPMERLASSIPLKMLYKHVDSLLSIEAMLFGHTTLLDSAPADDPYVMRLTSEYQFMAKKFSISSPRVGGWKVGGTRPGNFPHRRIALLAHLIFSRFHLTDTFTSVNNADEAMKIFNIPLTGYWHDRYTFGSPGPRVPESLSASSLRGLVINVVAPFSVARATAMGTPDASERAVAILESLPPESNSIVSLFASAGIKARDALTSQALIQARREYCEARKCLYCRIGHRLLAAAAHRTD